MRIKVKDTACPYCLSLLVLDGERITCETNCELQQDLDWHPETQAKIQPVIDWQHTLVGDRQK